MPTPKPAAKVTKTVVRKLKSLEAQITKSRAKLAAERDLLRELISEVEALLEPLDRADESLGYGLGDMKSAIEALSEEV